MFCFACLQLLRGHTDDDVDAPEFRSAVREKSSVFVSARLLEVFEALNAVS